MTIHRMFSDKADLYARIRPRYPREIYDFLAKATPCHDLAWDCACGNGQVASDLAKYFDRVAATDVSQEQLSQAPPVDGVT
ncbi:MAG: SAM-dependent methyltransferase, partial [Planctomycetota bacterium]